MDYFFANNINGTEETGIVNVKTLELICLCTEENSKIILDALELASKSKTRKIHRELTRDELKKYNHFLRVGGLKKFLDKHQLPDDAIVVVQRVEDFYYEKNNWGVYLKEGESSWSAKRWNKDIEDGAFLDKEQYPDMIEEDLKPFTEEQLRQMLEQYTPAWSCVRYEDDKDILFIDLHY